MTRDQRGRAWESYFTTTTRLTVCIEAALKRTCHLSMPEYNVLLQTSRAGDQGIRLGALAREVVFSPSRLTHTLKRLCDRGLLERTPCAEDGRGAILTLTPAGEELFASAADVHRELVRSLVLNDLEPGEAEVLERVFNRIAANVDALG